ncbi:lytic polysaccharide monooxygenase [Aulographum hederae CBS 113979]|uniref:AA9 family lytic polysaccharide monooxygenase n=1 Tax=Aulographum hederae CBS 113979 TaxID=1176131 RepID=A0A6G1H727_9PEZI|nr:lytic polysaccharide monooxygenase [Aulographum hederae CBS 113979]
MKSFLHLLVAAGTVSAHATFQDLWVGTKDEAETCVRPASTNSPITSVTSPDIRCNAGGAKGVAGLCKVSAGSPVSVEMHQQPGDRSCTNEALGGKHYGPVNIYMSPVADATTDDGSGEWFKVAQDTYAGTDESWGTEMLNTNCGKKTFTVPKELKAGQYLVRAEAIALHTAGSEGGAQFYLGCYQVEVEGTGTATPPASAMVKFPGAYKATDPGIKVDIYTKPLEYQAPGPEVWPSAA